MNKLHVYIKFHEKNVTGGGGGIFFIKNKGKKKVRGGGGGGIYFPKNKAIINVCTNVCHRFEI